MTQRISHDVNGDRILITVDFPDCTIVARESGLVSVTMDDTDWRDTAKRVLNEYNHAERRLTPDQVVKRITDGLTEAATRAYAADSREVAQMRMASSVLHRLADFVQSGTITGIKLVWNADDPEVVHVTTTTKLREIASAVQLGRGVVVSQAREL